MLLFLLSLAILKPCEAYAVFSHQELIDLVWADSIRPLLVQRYPRATDADLELARAYAYGGCTIQDLGYYPFGKKIFSDLTHYVRSGDFIVALLRNAKNINDYAFALGALSHYVGDSIGHSQAVNPSTAVGFPNLEKDHGSVVTYENAPYAHVRTEFGFDIVQIALRRYAPGSYREHIGFRVSRRLLDEAFYETYGLSVRDILGPERSATQSYRYSVRKLLPLFARATVVKLRHKLPAEADDGSRKEFLAMLEQTDYRKRKGFEYRPPGFTAYVLAIVIAIVPKIGVLQVLSTKAPSSETEGLYIRSMNECVRRFRKLGEDLRDNRSPENFSLPNRDLDTGAKVRPGQYGLTDKTYAQLLAKLISQQTTMIPSSLRQNILEYYADPKAPITTKKHKGEWKKVMANLEKLKTYYALSEPEPVHVSRR